ncbi:MAG: hypothetical protein CMP66_04985 [Flavobacteriales bacterium]|nr:hypothetical protein [Flavobacteriales bacterium]|tara:strand:- start:3803 stop:4954 length:1152 start_codon:yes stop_codon:yes gene_type:complete
MNNSVFNVNSVECGYLLLRNITTQVQKDSNTTVFVGIINSDQLLPIPDDENVRRFLGKKEAISGKVQQDIFDSLECRSENFSLLNGGVTIIARSVRVNSDSNKLLLVGPSIINGSQTRGVMGVFHQQSEENKPVPTKVEIIVTTDDDLIAEISISRNVQTKVKDFSIAGRRGAFKSINKALEESTLPYRIVEDESDRDGLQPSLLLQLLFLLMPKDLWIKNLPDVKYVKSSIYSSTAKWLKIFADDIYLKSEKGDKSALELMDYIEQVSLIALPLYFEWQSSQEWKGIRVQQGISRDSSNNIVKVSNGWLFPIICGHSVWIKKDSKGKWKLNKPLDYTPKGLIKFIKGFYDNDVNKLGKNQQAYLMTEITLGAGTSTKELAAQ